MCKSNDFMKETSLYINTMMNEQVKLTPLADDAIGHFPIACI